MNISFTKINTKLVYNKDNYIIFSLNESKIN